MAHANHQCFPTSVDISSKENQLTTARRLIDQLYKHKNEWYSTILLEIKDFSDSNLLNKYFLEYAGRGLPQHFNYCKYVFPIKYSTDDGFDGNGFKNLVTTLSDSSQKSGYSIIKKRFYKYLELKYARIVCSRYEYYRGKIDQRQSSQYRDHSYHNDRNNSWGNDGKKLVRK